MFASAKNFVGRRWPVLLAVAHVVLALAYGFVNPPFEAHDETGHFAYVTDLARTGALPNALDESDRALLDQSHQPPLYYAIGATLTSWLDRGDVSAPTPNAFAFDGTNRRGVRILLREPGEAFPWNASIAWLHAVRAVSAVLGGLMTFCIAKSAQLIFGDRASAAWLSAAIAGFNPQALFMSSMVNNDVMVSLLGALAAYHVLRLAASRDKGDSARRALGLSAALGATLGASVLAKNSSYALLAFAAFALVFLAWRQRWGVATLVKRGLAVAVPALLIALPYIGYNCARYAGRCLIDRNPTSPILQAPASVIGEGLSVGLRDAWLPQIFANAFRTSWGVFGWGSVLFPDAVYDILALFCAAGAMGFVLGFVRADKKLRDQLVVLVALGVVMMLLPGYRAIFFQTPALMPGRYLMPALTAYACIVGFGWSTIFARVPTDDPASRRLLSFGVIAALALLAIAPVAVVFPRAYFAQVSANAPSASPLLTFGDTLQLLDLRADNAYLPDREGTRQYARIQATWRALKPSEAQLAYGLSVLGRDQEVLGTMNVFPAHGNFPSTNWRAGDTWSETYDVLLEKPCASLPTLGRVNVSVYRAEFTPTAGGFPAVSAGEPLPARDANGNPTTPIVGRFQLGAPANMAVFWQPALAMFGSPLSPTVASQFGAIGLREANFSPVVAPGGELTTTLQFELWRATPRDAKAFVHVLDAAGKLVAQDDKRPDEHFPTDFWREGQCARQTFRVALPRDAGGTLRVVAGLYDAATAERFPTGAPDDVVVLGEARVSPKP